MNGCIMSVLDDCIFKSILKTITKNILDVKTSAEVIQEKL